MGDDAPRLPLEVGDDVLVTHLEHGARRQDVPPDRHQRLVSAVVTAEFREVVGIGQIRRKVGRETR